MTFADLNKLTSEEAKEIIENENNIASKNMQKDMNELRKTREAERKQKKKEQNRAELR